MSFSFTVTAATRADAREKIKSELAEVVNQQPGHAADRDAAQAAAESLIDILPDDATRDLVVSVFGSIISDGTQPYSLGLSINAHRAIRDETTTA